jgi:hypothetical protein
MKRQTKEMYDTKQYYNITKHIFCKFVWGEGPQRQELLLLNVHLRAMPDAGEIRTRQARLARAYTDAPADDLADLWAFAADPAAETHLVHKQFDRMLVTPGLADSKPEKKGFVFKSFSVRKDLVIRGAGQDKDHMDIFWQIPQDERDVSDHYPIVAEYDVRP